jgi:uncharacterized protein YfdQ (DUF2303 family)
MDGETVDKIAALATLAERLGPLPIETAIPALANGNGQIITVEHLMPSRARYRGTFVAGNLEALGQYVRKHTTHGGTEVYVSTDNKNLTARAFLNLGSAKSPGHGDWQAVANLTPSKAFLDLCAMTVQRLSQKQLAEYVEDYAQSIVALDSAGDYIPLAAALASIRSMTIARASELSSTVGDMAHNLSAMEQVEARAKAGSVPATLRVTLEPYDGMLSRSIDLRLGVSTGDEKVTFVARIVGSGPLRDAIIDEFRNNVRSTMSGMDVDVFDGEFSNGK